VPVLSPPTSRQRFPFLTHPNHLFKLRCSLCSYLFILSRGALYLRFQFSFRCSFLGLMMNRIFFFLARTIFPYKYRNGFEFPPLHPFLHNPDVFIARLRPRASFACLRQPAVFLQSWIVDRLEFRTLSLSQHPVGSFSHPNPPHAVMSPKSFPLLS